MGEGVLGQYIGPTGPQALPLRVDANGQLYVVMTGADIEIGAVEIKDGGSDLRAVVTAAGLQVFTTQALPAGANNIGDVGTAPVDCAAADVNTPAVNTAAVVTYGAAAGLRHVITGIAWSYAGQVPVGGSLVVTDAGAVVFSEAITDEGPGFYVFPSPKRSAAVNTAMVITLAAGGAACTGRLSILNHWLE